MKAGGEKSVSLRDVSEEGGLQAGQRRDGGEGSRARSDMDGECGSLPRFSFSGIAGNLRWHRHSKTHIVPFSPSVSLCTNLLDTPIALNVPSRKRPLFSRHEQGGVLCPVSLV